MGVQNVSKDTAKYFPLKGPNQACAVRESRVESPVTPLQ